MSLKGNIVVSIVAITAASAGTAVADESAGKISKSGAAPTFRGDGWEFKVGGRVQIDYAISEADNTDVEFNGSELRRLRLGVSGKMGSTIKYKVELNTDSGNEVNVEDAYLQWTPEGSDWSVKLGQHKTANSLDEQTSSRFISVLERAAFTDAFEFNRRVGVSVSTSGDNHTFTAGVFGENLDATSREEGYALAARGTYTPVNTVEALVHLGASVRHRENGDTQSDIRYRQRPVTHFPGRIISTGRIADSDNFYGVEAAGIFGNTWIAGEYGVTNASCSEAAIAGGACTSDPDFDGAYVEAGAFFGGKKAYKNGKFNRPKVDNPVNTGGNGAVSFVARYDTISLSDSVVNGGEYNSFVLGADWWPTKYTRLGLNYFNVDADIGTSTSGLDSSFAALVTAGTPTESVSGVIFRAQFDF